jgi:hypothetical protein
LIHFAPVFTSRRDWDKPLVKQFPIQAAAPLSPRANRTFSSGVLNLEPGNTLSVFTLSIETPGNFTLSKTDYRSGAKFNMAGSMVENYLVALNVIHSI